MTKENIKPADLPADSATIIKGTIAAKELREAGAKNLGRWLDLARGWQDAQNVIMRMAYANAPKGSEYNRCFALWMAAPAHDDMRAMLKAAPGDAPDSGKVHRSNLLAMLREEKRLDEWWKTLLAVEHSDMGSPITIMKRFRKWKAEGSPARPAAKKEPRAKGMDKDAEIKRLREVNAKLVERINRAESDALDGLKSINGVSVERMANRFYRSDWNDTAILKLSDKLRAVITQRERDRAERRKAEKKGGKP